MKDRLSRREFLGVSGTAALALGLASLRIGAAAPSDETALASSGAHGTAGAGAPSYGDWRDVYTEKWRWDRIARCSHTRANCLSACSWDVYVKDGLVWREEQAAAYDAQGRDGAPDFFPRGCQKGACYSSLMTSPQRLRYPLERVGPRGSGKWKRISWDEALDKTAEGVLAAATAHGPETVVATPGPNFDQGPGSAAEFRFLRCTGSTVLDTFAGIGDMPIGLIQTYGLFLTDGTSDDFFNSDYIVFWSANPVYTRIPDMHFFTGVRYRGARIVTVGPDYSATATRSDLWLNPKFGTDPALACAMAQVMIAEGLIDRDYVREQTDLPFLVRVDDGRFLREADVKAGGRDDVFYVWDEATGAPAIAPGSQGMSKPTLALGAIRPSLEGTYEVRATGGARIGVETVFERLRRHLNDHYTPEQAAAVTTIGAETIRTVARDMAKARAAIIYASVGTCKHYHSDLMHRSMALLMALTGNHGRRGGGLRMGSWWALTGFDELSQMEKMPWWQRLLIDVTGRPAVRDVEAFLREHSARSMFSPVIPWLYVHGGYAEGMSRASYNDADNPLGHDEAMKTSIEKGWMPIYPAPGKDPKVFLVTACNPLRQWPAPQVALEHLWPKFDLVVNINTQMSTTGLESDIVMPAAGFYEKEGIKYSWGFVPYLVLADKAVEPLGESRNEWWIFGAMARKIQEKAKSQGVTAVRDALGNDLDFSRVYDRWTDSGAFSPEDQSTAMDFIFERSEICEGTTWKESVQRGVVPIKRNGLYSSFCNVSSDVEYEKPLYPHKWQVEEKESWPTITGRQQFYLDHEWYLRAGEAFPVHKDPPAAGGAYPLRINGGHTRWSIHTIWRCEPHMLQLQRGEPVVYMNDRDAQARGIADNDRVRVFNDVGGFECVAKPAPAVQPGEVIIYHAWESFQFKDHKGQQQPIAAPWKTLHLAGDYGQLHYRGLYGAPNFGPRGATVEVKRA